MDPGQRPNPFGAPGAIPKKPCLSQGSPGTSGSGAPCDEPSRSESPGEGPSGTGGSAAARDITRQAVVAAITEWSRTRQLRISTGASEGKASIKDWIVCQVNSGKFPGVEWEDEERTRFRIPVTPLADPCFEWRRDGELGVVYIRERGNMPVDASFKGTRGRRRMLAALRRTRGLQEIGKGISQDGHHFLVFRVRKPEEEQCVECGVVAGAVHDFNNMARLLQEGFFSPGQCLPGEIVTPVPSCTTAEGQEAVIDWGRLFIRMYYNGEQVHELLTTSQSGCRISSALRRDPAVHYCAVGSPGQVWLPNVPNLACEIAKRELCDTLDACAKGILLTSSCNGIFCVCYHNGPVHFIGNTVPPDSGPLLLPQGKPTRIFNPNTFLVGLANSPLPAPSHVTCPLVKLWLGKPVAVGKLEPHAPSPRDFAARCSNFSDACVVLEIMPKPLWDAMQ
nr:vIRF-1 [Human gammaherpesvirus 8]